MLLDCSSVTVNLRVARLFELSGLSGLSGYQGYQVIRVIRVIDYYGFQLLGYLRLLKLKESLGLLLGLLRR